MIYIVFTIVFSNYIFASINLEDELYSPNVGVYNLENMELLYGENVDKTISFASITKVMTAIVSIENIQNINESITIDYSYIQNKVDSELVTAGIYDGQVLTYYDLIATMLVPSGADSAEYLANIIFENEDTFINKMNEKAQELGMNNTSFSNVTGLDDDNNYSTINDLAKMMKYAMENETLKEIMSLSEYTTTDSNITVRSTIDSARARYGIDVDYIIGGKTGTTGDAGLCLASFSEDEGVELLTIVTGASMYSSTMYNVIDTETIYESIINSYSMQNIVSVGDLLYEIPCVCTKQDSVNVLSKEDVLIYTDVIDKDCIKIEYEGLESLDYTIKEGETIGKIKVYYDENFIKEMDVTLDEKLEFSLIKWININIENIIIFTGVLIIFISVIILIYKKKNLNRKKDRKYSKK